MATTVTVPRDGAIQRGDRFDLIVHFDTSVADRTFTAVMANSTRDQNKVALHIDDEHQADPDRIVRAYLDPEETVDLSHNLYVVELDADGDTWIRARVACEGQINSEVS